MMQLILSSPFLIAGYIVNMSVLAATLRVFLVGKGTLVILVASRALEHSQWPTHTGQWL
jgi:hypothetical protein